MFLQSIWMCRYIWTNTQQIEHKHETLFRLELNMTLLAFMQLCENVGLFLYLAMQIIMSIVTSMPVWDR